MTRVSSCDWPFGPAGLFKERQYKLEQSARATDTGHTTVPPRCCPGVVPPASLNRYSYLYMYTTRFSLLSQVPPNKPTYQHNPHSVRSCKEPSLLFILTNKIHHTSSQGLIRSPAHLREAAWARVAQARAQPPPAACARRSTSPLAARTRASLRARAARPPPPPPSPPAVRAVQPSQCCPPRSGAFLRASPSLWTSLRAS